MAEDVEHSLASLLRISDSFNSTFDLESLLNALVKQALELTGAEAGCAGLRTARGMSCDHFLRGAEVVPLIYDCGPGIGWPGWALTKGTYYFTNDASLDPLIVRQVREMFGVESGMCIPILDGQRDVIAFFKVYNKRGRGGFSPQDLKEGLAIAQIASLAIQNSLTYGNLRSLAALSQALVLAGDLEQVLEVVGHHLETNFHCGSVILLPADKELIPRFRTSGFPIGHIEEEAAAWCREHGQETGASTAIMSDASAHYVPLRVRSEVIGVVGIEVSPGAWVPLSARELFAGLVGQSALAIERWLLEQKVRRLRFLDESDRVQNALLAAISHEVRAPIAAITAAVSGLLTPGAPLERALEQRLLRTAESEVNRLHRLMNNLLSVTRLQAGASRLKLELCDLSDVVGAALEELGGSRDERQILIEIPTDLPLISMDFVLITQVLVNLFSNALKFSPPEQVIRLHSQTVDDKLEVKVIDRGLGVPEGDFDRVFEKFHRLSQANSADGLGLGLSICKEFVEAHRGRIMLEQNPEGGTIATFVLPIHSAGLLPSDAPVT